MTLYPARSFATVMQAVGAAAAIVLALVTGNSLWMAIGGALGVLAIIGWSQRIELARNGDEITVTWRNLLGQQRQTAFLRSAIIRVDASAIKTHDGDIELAVTDQVRAFIS
jgi:hypothetical protein